MCGDEVCTRGVVVWAGWRRRTGLVWPKGEGSCVMTCDNQTQLEKGGKERQYAYSVCTWGECAAR